MNKIYSVVRNENIRYGQYSAFVIIAEKEDDIFTLIKTQCNNQNYLPENFPLNEWSFSELGTTTYIPHIVMEKVCHGY